MTDDKKFPFAFEEPITTEKEVDTYSMVIDKDSKTPRLKTVKQKMFETVTYHNAPEKEFACRKGEHNYVMIDTHKYIAKCTKCAKHWKMNPQYHKLLDGHILHRDLNHVID